jgi:hypothetical protein
MWWVEPQQKIHFDVIEGDVWHCTPKMLDRKYLQFYKMTFLAFEYYYKSLHHLSVHLQLNLLEHLSLLKKL